MDHERPAVYHSATDSQKHTTIFERITTVTAFTLIALIYWCERSRSIGWGDSVGFLKDALDGFSWRISAQEHLLYTNVNALLVRMAPSFDPLTVLIAVSIVFALLTLVQVYRTSLIVTKNRYAVLLSMIGFAFSFTFWRQAEHVEVYTFATFLSASALHAIFSDTVSNDYRHAPIAGVWMGLGILTHIQTLLLMPMFVVYLAFAWRVRPRSTVPGFLFPLAGLLILVVAAMIMPSYPVSTVFFGFHFNKLIMQVSFRYILIGGLLSVGYLLYAFHLHIPAMIIGMKTLARSSRKVFILCLAGIIPVWGFAMRYRVPDQYVFFLNAYLILGFVAAPGYAQIVRSMRNRAIGTVLLIMVFVASPIIYETAVRTAPFISQIQAFGEQKAYKGGISYFLRPGLRTIPDPLDLYKRQQASGFTPTNVDKELWNRLSVNISAYLTLREKGREEEQNGAIH